MRKPDFAYTKTKPQISCAVTAQLISAFVFATRTSTILYPKFQASSHLLFLYRPICVRAGRKSRRPVFSRRGSCVPRQATKTLFSPGYYFFCLCKTVEFKRVTEPSVIIYYDFLYDSPRFTPISHVRLEKSGWIGMNRGEKWKYSVSQRFQ